MKAGLFSEPTPFTPHTPDDGDKLSLLRLARSRRVGATTFHRMLAEYGSAQEALSALPHIAKAAGVRDYLPCPEGVAKAEVSAGHKTGARLLTYGGVDYPKALIGLSDAPAVLWALGDVSLLARPCVAVVGARAASSLGLRMSRRLAADLGEAGFVIVSGLARGIDAAAHEAALETGTIAVQAGGIDTIYPAENADLAARLAKSGLRLSELPPGFAPRAQHFPQRNRIIAGLSRATLVVEAAIHSGSIGTAHLALDYGRDVMAVPGHPLDARAGGCNALLRDGAVLVRDARDVIDCLGAPHPAPCPPAPQPSNTRPETDDLADRILALLGTQPVQEEGLLSDLGTDAASFAAAILPLEIEGQVLRHPGGYLSRPPPG